MGRYIYRIHEIGFEHVAVVGGKGAQLGELSKIGGIEVPEGFCITTKAFADFVARSQKITSLMEEFSSLDPNELTEVQNCAAELRRAIRSAEIPEETVEAIRSAVALLGRETPCAVRSSATAEDLPVASFAGQQDTYLNVVGEDEIFNHVRQCWASLFTDRAVTYRQHHHIDHALVHMAVVVQRMVFPRASGVVFTADPVTSNRRVVSVEAAVGLGDALMAGQTNSDHYTVSDGKVVEATIAAKGSGVVLAAAATDGSPVSNIEPERAVLTEEEILDLVKLTERVEAHFGSPQDIEWCLTGRGFRFVQSRPITTLFPIPEVDDEENHIFLSVGHQQMMTDAMKPLGLSFWQMATPAPMYEAGGRLFADATAQLSVGETRAQMLSMWDTQDPLTADAVRQVLGRDDFHLVESTAQGSTPVAGSEPVTMEPDPAIPAALIKRVTESVAAAEEEIRGKSGSELLDFILTDMDELRSQLFAADSMSAIMAGMQAAWWLNENLQTWLGENNVADTLSLSAPNNVTAEMGLALLDVADVIRPHPEVIDLLNSTVDDGFLDALPTVAGGEEARVAITSFLEKYGMRCVGEIDITRPRWEERPSALLPIILTHVRTAAPGAADRRFESGRLRAEQKAHAILEELRKQPDGIERAEETARMINQLRTFTGYREFPKFGKVKRDFLYRRALLAESERLHDAGVIDQTSDIEFLRFDELREVVRTGEMDRELVRRRREQFASYTSLTPPRVLTSDGEALSGAYRRNDVPDGGLVGLPVSLGVAEGRARVVSTVSDAVLESGDILVTAFTDPSWSPLFPAVSGLVTEVGGQLTHGAVVAREYGLPAVVGVPDATTRINNGQRIRVDGSTGIVNILD